MVLRVSRSLHPQGHRLISFFGGSSIDTTIQGDRREKDKPNVNKRVVKGPESTKTIVGECLGAAQCQCYRRLELNGL